MAWWDWVISNGQSFFIKQPRIFKHAHQHFKLIVFSVLNNAALISGGWFTTIISIHCKNQSNHPHIYSTHTSAIKVSTIDIEVSLLRNPYVYGFNSDSKHICNTEHHATCAYFLIFAAVHLSESRHIRSSCIAEFELLGKGTMSSISADDGDTNISLSSFFVL